MVGDFATNMMLAWKCTSSRKRSTAARTGRRLRWRPMKRSPWRSATRSWTTPTPSPPRPPHSPKLPSNPRHFPLFLAIRCLPSAVAGTRFSVNLGACAYNPPTGYKMPSILADARFGHVPIALYAAVETAAEMGTSHSKVTRSQRSRSSSVAILSCR